MFDINTMDTTTATMDIREEWFYSFVLLVLGVRQSEQVAGGQECQCEWGPAGQCGQQREHAQHGQYAQHREHVEH